MKNTISCFDSKSESYLKYRPHYPFKIVQLLKLYCGLNTSDLIVDVGSGTGFLSEPFLKNGNRVIGIEPNNNMRSASKNYLSHYKKFSASAGFSHETHLKSSSVDFILCGQSFHLFEKERTKKEFMRIIKNNGVLAIVSNNFDLTGSDFTKKYYAILSRYFKRYTNRDLNLDTTDHEEINTFFLESTYECQEIKHSKHISLEAAVGLFASFSLSPQTDTPEFKSIKEEIALLFHQEEVNQSVKLDLSSMIYYGKIPASTPKPLVT